MMSSPRIFSILFVTCLVWFNIQSMSKGTNFFSDAKDIYVFLTSTKPMPWDSIQETGGIKIGTPVRKTTATVSLPIICDVSGLSTITQKPTTMNSALVVYKTDVKVEKNQILISVITGLISEKHNDMCQPVTLYNVPSGKYNVFYYDAHKKYLIGSTVIP